MSHSLEAHDHTHFFLSLDYYSFALSFLRSPNDAGIATPLLLKVFPWSPFPTHFANREFYSGVPPLSNILSSVLPRAHVVVTRSSFGFSLTEATVPSSSDPLIYPSYLCLFSFSCCIGRVEKTRQFAEPPQASLEPVLNVFSRGFSLPSRGTFHPAFLKRRIPVPFFLPFLFQLFPFLLRV